MKYLVYSHEHTDHIGAAYLFPKDVKIVAQKETAEILAQRKDPRKRLPTIIFADSYELNLGDQTLTLNYRHQSRARQCFYLRTKAKDINARGCGLSRVRAL